MSKLFKGALIAGLLGVPPAPVLAQPQGARGMQANRGQQARRGQAHAAYRQVSVSRGHQWRTGQRLAVSQRRHAVNDWSQRGLRAPPRGYRWVRENNNSGDYILIAAATGLIASILSQ